MEYKRISTEDEIDITKDIDVDALTTVLTQLTDVVANTSRRIQNVEEQMPSPHEAGPYR